MLAIALAIGASLGWGTADFLGGLKSRSVRLLSVLLISQGTALVTLAVFTVWRGASPPDGTSLVFAAVAGSGEAVAIAALYRGLAVGVMSVVAPVAATAPVFPLAMGFANGAIPGPVQGAGLALAVIGIVATSIGRGSRDATVSRATLTRSTFYGLVAAFGFGVFLFTMDRASEGDVPWALLIARTTAVTAIATAALVRRSRLDVQRSDLPVIAFIGILIVVADSLYATASSLASLGVVAVLGSLHPIATMGLARVRLDERLALPQRIGIVITLGGVLAIAGT